MADEHDDGLPVDPTARAAAVAQQFAAYRAALEELTTEDATMPDEHDDTEPQPLTRPPLRAALLAALEVSGAWASPPDAAREVGSVFQSLLVGQIKLDPRQIPVALAVLAQVNQYVAEAVAAIAPSSDIRH